jgi:hypothetical protein
MLELLKISNGLKKSPNTEGNVFLDIERYFTNTQLMVDVNGQYVPSGLPYMKLSDLDFFVELEENIVILTVSDIMVDGNVFNNSDECINYIFGNA